MCAQPFAQRLFNSPTILRSRVQAPPEQQQPASQQGKGAGETFPSNSAPYGVFHGWAPNISSSTGGGSNARTIYRKV